MKKPYVLSNFGTTASPEDTFGVTWDAMVNENLILRGAGSAFYAPPRSTALTAKFAFSGEETYHVQRRPLIADDEAWVVIGRGEKYECRVPPGGSVSWVSVFFEDCFVAEVRGQRRTRDEALLEGASVHCEYPLVLGRRRLPYDRAIRLLVQDALASAEDDGVYEEVLHIALARILDHSERAAAEWDRLPSLRASTRGEIHRRLCLAHDLIASAYADPLNLKVLARNSGMAPNYFLQRFRELFRITPHQALVARRVERARWLLAHTDEPVGRVGRTVGFASFGSFSSRFTREVGVSPRAYREHAAPSRGR